MSIFVISHQNHNLTIHLFPLLEQSVSSSLLNKTADHYLHRLWLHRRQHPPWSCNTSPNRNPFFSITSARPSPPTFWFLFFFRSMPSFVRPSHKHRFDFQPLQIWLCRCLHCCRNIQDYISKLSEGVNKKSQRRNRNWRDNGYDVGIRPGWSPVRCRDWEICGCAEEKERDAKIYFF